MDSWKLLVVFCCLAYVHLSRAEDSSEHGVAPRYKMTNCTCDVAKRDSRRCNEICPMEPLEHLRGISYINQLKPKPTGALILLHGSCGTGYDFQEAIQQLLGPKTAFPHIKLIFPTAPLTSYTPLGGAAVPTWYDISGFSRQAMENEADLETTAKDMMKIIRHEIKCGIPEHRIAIAGFSRGGGLAYHMGFRFSKGLAAIVVMSSFLPETSQVFEELKQRDVELLLPKLLQLHGKQDALVNIKEAQHTFSDLASLGIRGTYKEYEQLGHEVSKFELSEVWDFINATIPDNY